MPMYVPATGGGGGGIADAPSDGTDYIRKSAAWSQRFIVLPVVSGNWYQPDIGLTYNAGTNITLNIIRYSVLVLYQPTLIAELGVRLTTAVVSNIGLAIYASNPSTGAPTGTPLVQTASISIPTATAGLYSGVVTTPATLPAGVYWAAINSDTTGNICQIANISSGNAASWFGSPTFMDISITATTSSFNYILSSAFGSWPAGSGATRVATTANAQAVAAVFYRAG